MSWYDDAACAGMPVAIWFEPIPSYESRARWVCSDCPVAVRCISEAVRNGDRGIRGGLTYKERPKTMRMPAVYRVAS